jgi:hypothetical protein
MAGSKKIHRVPNIKLVLERFSGNPILTPNKAHPWESVAVFNPAALYENGKVHILYRALGSNDVSTLGYASSRDGLHIDKRLPYPAYTPREPFEGVTSKPSPRREYRVSILPVVGKWGDVKTRA